MYALVKWLNGTDEGKLTHNVNTDWIIGFNPSKFSRTKSYAIEWRVPPRPRSGWAVTDALVLDVSDDLDYLREQMRENPATPSSTPSRSGSYRSTEDVLDFNNTEFQRVLQRTLERVVRNSNSSSIGTPPSTPTTPCSTRPLDESNVEQVKIGKVLFLSRSAHLMTKAARTPTSMTMILVRQAFSRRRLRRSSYAGQKRQGVVKPGLKTYRKMQDIQDFVLSRFPFLTQSAFSTAVNSCTGRNVDKTQERTFVDDMSDSEDEDIRNSDDERQ